VSKNYEPTYEGQLDKCQDERHALQMQLEEYQEALEFVRKEFHEALDDIEKMKAERDEARRELEEWRNSSAHVEADHPDEVHCGCVPVLRKLLTDARRERDEAMDEISLLRSTVTDCNIEIEQLRKERDEARRMACLQSCMGDDEPREWSPEDFAKQHGWDCFQQEETK
jgi:uncharacterized coiled-coil DUF342 family protein